MIDEIDKGWWVGEAHSKRGIFPVNYTEPYQQHEQDGKRKSETIPILPVTPPPQSIPVVSSDIPKTVTIDQATRSLAADNSNKTGVSPSQVGVHDSKITANISTDLGCSECNCHKLQDNPSKNDVCKQCNHKHSIPT